MFGRTPRQLLRINQNFLRRTVDPQDANTQMRTGPNYAAITATIIGVGTAYWVFNLVGGKDAKKTMKTDEKDLKNPPSS